MMTLDDAIRALRNDPDYADLVQNAYLGADASDSAKRFRLSSEFKALNELLGTKINDATVLDIGAGVGIASAAFAHAGALQVFALEPDASALVGLGAMHNVIRGLPILPIQAFGEHIPLATNSVDIIYGRQVLHHIEDLVTVFEECKRVLRPDGRMIFCREPMVETNAELDAWLQTHPVHVLAGGENAYTLSEYRNAFVQAGFTITRQWSHYDSVINYWPQSKSTVDRDRQKRISKKYGRIISRLSRFPLIGEIIAPKLKPYFPGMLYTFEVKPSVR